MDDTTLGIQRRSDHKPVSPERRLAYKPVLVSLEGVEYCASFVLDREKMIAGRDPSADIQINEPSVSRQHAIFEYLNHGAPDEHPRCQLTDKESMNGTFINGRRLSEPHALTSGDRVHLGDVCLGFFLRTDQEIDSDKRLRSMATTDSLTGLLNRAIMDVQFAREFERALRYQRPLSLMLVDLDDFKKVNDTWGHLFGDYVLREAAQCLRASIRAHDIAARYGGEEICVMMVETPREGAMKLAERVRSSIASHDFVVGEARTRITVSIGVADFDCDRPKSLRHFIQMADHALYDAKASGKNCVCHWTDHARLAAAEADKPAGERDLRGTAHSHRRPII